ncbi:uncharacterized protein LOC143456826 [Clavelina lepadiformis]|uniref:Uncharacterized protein n=1 Tax=Clavelina lepadiformis TaxID=159417 RepID=A0ABP0FXE5_CLALP
MQTMEHISLLFCLTASYLCVSQVNGASGSNTGGTCTGNCVTTDFFKQQNFTDLVAEIVQSSQQADLDCKVTNGTDFYFGSTGCRNCAVDCTTSSSSFQAECLKNCPGFTEKRYVRKELGEAAWRIQQIKNDMYISGFRYSNLNNDVASLRQIQNNLQQQLSRLAKELNQLQTEQEKDRNELTTVKNISISCLVLICLGFICTGIAFRSFRRHADKTYRTIESSAHQAEEERLSAGADERRNLRKNADQDEDHGTSESL